MGLLREQLRLSPGRVRCKASCPAVVCLYPSFLASLGDGKGEEHQPYDEQVVEGAAAEALRSLASPDVCVCV